jgi:hypothetical protein
LLFLQSNLQEFVYHYFGYVAFVAVFIYIASATYQTQNGKTYHFCYEYGNLPLDGDKVLLVKREDKID